MDISPQFPGLRKYQRRNLRDFPHEDVKQALEVILTQPTHHPPSLRQVAQQIGYLESSLKLRFPDLCRRIHVQFRQFHATQRAQMQRRLQEQITLQVRQIWEEGVFPSRRLMYERMEQPGCFRHPLVQATYRAEVAALPAKGQRTS